MDLGWRDMANSGKEMWVWRHNAASSESGRRETRAMLLDEKNCREDSGFIDSVFIDPLLARSWMLSWDTKSERRPGQVRSRSSVSIARSSVEVWTQVAAISQSYPSFDVVIASSAGVMLTQSQKLRWRRRWRSIAIVLEDRMALAA